MIVKAAVKSALKEMWFRLPHIRRRQNRYLTWIRAQYDYSANPPSILTPSCIGGLISHNLGLPFRSPTVNLWMDNHDFVKFACDLRHYLSLELTFLAPGEKTEQFQEGDYPVGKLGDLTVYFNHYRSDEEAKDAWNRRRERVDFQNLFLICDDNRLSDEEIAALEKVPCKRMILFTARHRPELPNSFWMRRYKSLGYLDNYNVREPDGFREFERVFNYARWLNGEKDFAIGEGQFPPEEV